MKVGSGLANLGNTCFFNAVMQCILHSSSLATIYKQHTSVCKSSNNWCIFCELSKLYSRSKQQRVVEPVAIVKNLTKIFKKFRLGRQEDAHEFLRFLIDGLQTADVAHFKEKNAQKLRKLVEQSSVFRVLGGLMKSSIECLNCHNKSEIVEHFYDMNLECQKSNSVAESLQSFFRIDKLAGANRYRCEHCKTLENANKRFLFHKMPEVLTIQLKRFTNSLNKLNKFVKYDPLLNVAPYTETPAKLMLYELFGVVVHAGATSYSGHYFSYIKDESGNWFKMDDSWVSKSDVNTALNQKAYLLFYRRKNPEVNTAKLPVAAKVVEQHSTDAQSPNSSNSNNKLEDAKTTPPTSGKSVQQQPNKVSFSEELKKAIKKNSEKIDFIDSILNKSEDEEAEDTDDDKITETVKINNQKKPVEKKEEQEEQENSDDQDSEDQDYEEQQQAEELESQEEEEEDDEEGSEFDPEEQQQNNQPRYSRRVPRRLRNLDRLRRFDGIIKKKKVEMILMEMLRRSSGQE